MIDHQHVSETIRLISHQVHHGDAIVLHAVAGLHWQLKSFQRHMTKRTQGMAMSNSALT